MFSSERYQSHPFGGQGPSPCTLETRSRAAHLARRTANAYMAGRYGSSWASCAVVLLDAGYDEREAEAILRSKHMRWAGDHDNGRHTSGSLRRYLEAYPISTSLLAALVADTFES